MGVAGSGVGVGVEGTGDGAGAEVSGTGVAGTGVGVAGIGVGVGFGVLSGAGVFSAEGAFSEVGVFSVEESSVSEETIVSEDRPVVISFVEDAAGFSVSESFVVISEDMIISEEAADPSPGILLVQAHKENNCPVARRMTKKRRSLFMGRPPSIL